MSSSASTPSFELGPPAETALGRFGQGFAAPWHGARFLCRHPGLWRYAILPIVLNLAITGLVLVLLFAGAAAFANHLHPRFPEGWLGVALEVAAVVALLAAALGAAALVWVVLQGLLTGYFSTRLARAVEHKLGTPP